jgi:hypothetical protein
MTPTRLLKHGGDSRKVRGTGRGVQARLSRAEALRFRVQLL